MVFIMKKNSRFLTMFLLAFMLIGCSAGKTTEKNAVMENNAAMESNVTAGDNAAVENDAEIENNAEIEKDTGAKDDAALETRGGDLETDSEPHLEKAEDTADKTGPDVVESDKAESEKEAPDKAMPDENSLQEADTGESREQDLKEEEKSPALSEDGTYTSKEDVALYIHLYGQLPSNFITKKEAEALGWTGGSLEPYAPGMCIGGSRFGNYEGLLPEEEGRIYTECDIDTLGAKKRGAKRIVFSNDGLIYYTEDHYLSFELLYEGE